MKILYLDLGFGAAGDMLAAALYELIDDRESVLAELNSYGLGQADFPIIEKSGFSGRVMRVKNAGGPIASPKDIFDLPIPEAAKDVFRLLGEAEARVHGKTPDTVHFHEIGRRENIAAVAAFALMAEKLGADRIAASPLTLGNGTVRCAHGLLPVPAPVTAELIRGLPAKSGDLEGERCTPTGAALVKRFCSDFGGMPEMETERLGLGLGTKYEGYGAARAFLGEASGSDPEICELYTNVDDMTAEDIGYLCEALRAAGAFEVYTAAVSMKKGRPGTLIRAVCEPSKRGDIAACFFKNSTTIGLREIMTRRCVLKRRVEERDTAFGKVRYKVSEGYGVLREKPEHDDLRRISLETGLSLEEIRKKL